MAFIFSGTRDWCAQGGVCERIAAAPLDPLPPPPPQRPCQRPPSMCTCGLFFNERGIRPHPGMEQLFNAEHDANRFEQLLLDNPLLWEMKHHISGWTPMMIAAQRGYLRVVNLLLDHGCNPDAHTCRWGSAISMAAHFGRHQVVSTLINRGADVEFSYGNVGPPLIIAAKRGHMRVVKVLLDCGRVNVDAVDVLGRTALSYAASRGLDDVVMALLDHGADTRVRDAGGMVAAGRALQTLNGLCANIIVERERNRNRVHLLRKARTIDSDKYIITTTATTTATRLSNNDSNGGMRTRQSTSTRRLAFLSPVLRARLTSPVNHHQRRLPPPTLTIHHHENRAPGRQEEGEVISYVVRLMPSDLFHELCEMIAL